MDLVGCATPMWFGASGIITELFFALVTLLIAFYAYRIYKIAHQRSSLFFGVAFLSISFAYFIQAIFNFLMLMQIQTHDIIPLATNAAAASAFQLSVFAVVFHIIFMILGVALLAYVTLKERSLKIYLLFLSLSFVGLILTPYFRTIFFLIVAFFLLFISAQHYQRHTRQRSTTTLLVFFGFALLFIGNLLLAAVTILHTFYVLSHIVIFVGYVLLLASLLRVVR